jgi:hypothetical protein
VIGRRHGAIVNLYALMDSCGDVTIELQFSVLKRLIHCFWRKIQPAYVKYKGYV